MRRRRRQRVMAKRQEADTTGEHKNAFYPHRTGQRDCRKYGNHKSKGDGRTKNGHRPCPVLRGADIRQPSRATEATAPTPCKRRARINASTVWAAAAEKPPMANSKSAVAMTGLRPHLSAKRPAGICMNACVMPYAPKAIPATKASPPPD